MRINNGADSILCARSSYSLLGCRCGVHRKRGGSTGEVIDFGDGWFAIDGRDKKCVGAKLNTRSPDDRKGIDETSDVIAGALLMVCDRLPLPIVC